ncbi:MAG: hypothetical protein M0R80_00705 [Proteobacteria bacterium]|nr:hypothetical protein [Pseudomonadota bacterium]
MQLIDLAPGHFFERSSHSDYSGLAGKKGTIYIKLDNNNSCGWCEVVDTSIWQHASILFEVEIVDYGPVMDVRDKNC